MPSDYEVTIKTTIKNILHYYMSLIYMVLEQDIHGYRLRVLPFCYIEKTSHIRWVPKHHDNLLDAAAWIRMSLQPGLIDGIGAALED